jgi:hypothetical protein
MLLFPAPEAHNVPWATLDGLHILVIVSAFKEASVAVGQQACVILDELGASVIGELVPPRQALGPCETAIVRVFISSLFATTGLHHQQE